MNCIIKRGIIIVLVIFSTLLITSQLQNAEASYTLSNNESIKAIQLLRVKITDVNISTETYLGFPFLVNVSVTNRRFFIPAEVRIIVFFRENDSSFFTDKVMGTSNWFTINARATKNISIECLTGNFLQSEKQGKVGVKIQYFKPLSKLSLAKIFQRVSPKVIFTYWESIILRNPVRTLMNVKIDDFTFYYLSTNKRLGSFATWSLHQTDQPELYALINVTNKCDYNARLKVMLSLSGPSTAGLVLTRSKLWMGETNTTILKNSKKQIAIRCDIPPVTVTGLYDVVADIYLLIGKNDVEIPAASPQKGGKIFIEDGDPFIKEVIEKVQEKLPLIFLYIAALAAVILFINQLIKISVEVLRKKGRRKK